MDHLLWLLSKAHSAFNQFAHDFSEAIFIRDPDDEAKVRAVLERKGLSWEYYKWAKGLVLNLCIRCYIPKSEILHEHLVMLFKAYMEVYCWIKRGRRTKFFSDDALEMIKRLLATVACGFVSDIQGFKLYYIMGVDKDGLILYRKIRGTSDIEGGFHMPIRRVFGSLRASPEMSEATIINWMVCQNQVVSLCTLRYIWSDIY